MDNITRAQLDALEGKRAPPDYTFLMGAGEYRSQLLLPSLRRDEKMRQMMSNKVTTTNNLSKQITNTITGGVAPGPAWATVRDGHVPGGDNQTNLVDALAVAEATMVSSEPVHVYDLKETAARKTQELIEKEKMVSSLLYI